MTKYDIFKNNYENGIKCEIDKDVLLDYASNLFKRDDVEKAYKAYEKILKDYGLDESYFKTLLVTAKDHGSSYSITFNPNEIIDKIYTLLTLDKTNNYRSFEYKKLFNEETYTKILTRIKAINRNMSDYELKNEYPYLYFEYKKSGLDKNTFLNSKLDGIERLIKNFKNIIKYCLTASTLINTEDFYYDELRLLVYYGFEENIEAKRGSKEERRSTHILLGNMAKNYKDDDTYVVKRNGMVCSYKDLIGRMKLTKNGFKFCTPLLKESEGEPKEDNIRGPVKPLSEEDFKRLKDKKEEKIAFYTGLKPILKVTDGKFLTNGYSAFVLSNGVVILDKIPSDDLIRQVEGSAVKVTDIDHLICLLTEDKKSLKEKGIMKSFNHTDTWKERVQEASSKAYCDEEEITEKVKTFKKDARKLTKKDKK